MSSAIMTMILGLAPKVKEVSKRERRMGFIKREVEVEGVFFLVLEREGFIGNTISKGI